MKKFFKYFLLSGISLLSLAASAQLLDEDTTTNQPFFKAKKINSRCYVGFEGMVSQILKKKAAMLVGADLNWVVNHKYVVSVKYDVLTTPVNVGKILAPSRSDTVNIIHQFAGLGFSYILFDNKKFSFQPGLTAGWGMIKYTYGGVTSRKDFAELVPGVYGIYNATKFFRFGVGLNYRATIGASLHGIKDADISGISGIVFIRVGTF